MTCKNTTSLIVLGNPFRVLNLFISNHSCNCFHCSTLKYVSSLTLNFNKTANFSMTQYKYFRKLG